MTLGDDVHMVTTATKGSVIMELPPDATLRDLKSMLADPDAFISRACGVIHRLRRHGDVQMRLGVTGTGRFPNYRIEEAGSGKPIMAIDGANHEAWPDGANLRALARGALRSGRNVKSRHCSARFESSLERG